MSIVSRTCLFKRILLKISRIIPIKIREIVKQYNHNRIVFALKRQGIYEKDFPEVLSLGLSARCQARCIFCPDGRGKGIEPPFMPFELAKQIIDEAKEEKFMGLFRFSENGEALLNRSFLRIYEYYKTILPQSKSVLYSNMGLLDKKIGVGLLKLGLDELNINVDGASKETYEYTKKLNFENMKRNLHNFIESRRQIGSKCRITVNILTAKKYMKVVEKVDVPLPDDTKEVIKYWSSYLNDNDIFVVVDFPYTWAVRERLKKPKSSPCGKFTKVVRECLIGPNGDIYACCLDYRQKLIHGNIKDSSIRKIWNSNRRNKIIELLEHNHFKAIGEPCKFCCELK